MLDPQEYESVQCALNPSINQYKRFSEIPADMVSESSLVAWIYHGGKFREIPKEMHTQRIFWTAARWDFGAYLEIDLSQVDDLRGMSLSGVIGSMTNFEWLPPELRNEQFVVEMTIEDASALADLDLEEEFEYLLTDYVVSEVCSRSLDHAYQMYSACDGIVRPLIKDEYLEAALMNCPRSYWKLKEMGREEILPKVLAAGYWPAKDSFEEHPEFAVPPATIAEAFERVKSLGNDPFFKAIHRVWIDTKPMDDIVEVLQGSKAGIDHLFEHYPEKELRQYMKTYRPLRGRFLENDLGM